MTSAFAHLLDEGTPPLGYLGCLGYLGHAIAEAVQGVGRTAPNPPVGAVVVDDDPFLGSGRDFRMGVGFHARAGERHAEIVALDAARERGYTDFSRAALYVTLEPCVHHGRTPPCTDRLVAERVGRVIVGAVDPNPRVHEKGIATLRAAGIRVELATGEAGERCKALIAPFCRALVDKTPYVVLKCATSMDGRVACANGASRFITGPQARSLVHRLRDNVDAVLVGAGTVLADDPALTVREVDVAKHGRPTRNPLRVVLDGSLRSSPSARVFEVRAGEPAPVVLHGAWADGARTAAFDRAGVRRVVVNQDPGPMINARPTVDLAAALAALVPLGVMAVLVEAGPTLATPLIQRGLVDELWWFQAPIIVGGDGIPVVGPMSLASPDEAPRMKAVHRAITGNDALTILIFAR